jgi:hypothetical protein
MNEQRKMTTTAEPAYFQRLVRQKVARERSFVATLKTMCQLYGEYMADPQKITYVTVDLFFPDVYLFGTSYFFVLSFRSNECIRHLEFELWGDEDSFFFDEETPARLGLEPSDVVPFTGPKVRFKIRQFPLTEVLDGMRRAGEWLRKNKSKMYWALFQETVDPFLRGYSRPDQRLEIDAEVFLGRRVPDAEADAFVERYGAVLDREDIADVSVAVMHRPKSRPVRNRSETASRIFPPLKINGTARRLFSWNHGEHRKFLGRLLFLRRDLLLLPGQG